ncbi:MAG: HlyC/CorC family transporter [Bacteroidaceae bacterium]|nr:HlyC/CorC family transporter [Bacteroidaceae bacterium]
MNELFIIFGLILLNGVFAMAEIALISARKSSLSASAKRGSVSARFALKLAEEPDKFLSTVQIGITVIGIVTGIYSGSMIAARFSSFLASQGIPLTWSEEIAQTVIVVLVTYLTLVFGELLPKRIGMNAAEKVAKFMARPMHLLSTIASPFVWLLSQSTAFLIRIMGLESKGSKVTEEEIKSIVREGAEDGEVQEVEQDIVERVFLMGDLNVDSIMTHKHELVWFDVNMTADEVRELIADKLHEGYPVADGSLDNIVGFVAMKDFVLNLERPDFSLRSLAVSPTYFYENMSVYKVLEIMKNEGISRGIVCDEFGSCIGIVTLKDIMMGLVGAVNEGGEETGQSIVKRDGRDEWLIDGQCFIYDFLRYFEAEELFTNENYTTVAGLFLEELNHIPVPGEKIQWNKFIFEVADMDGARIDKLIVTINNKEE